MVLTVKGTLRNYDGDGNGNAKKVMGLMRKTVTLQVHHPFFVHFFAVLAQIRREMTKFESYGNGQAINFTISV